MNPFSREMVRCGDCVWYIESIKKHFDSDGKVISREFPCKAIDHKIVRFCQQIYLPYSDTFRNHLPCKYFEPNGNNGVLLLEWHGFEDWYRDHVAVRMADYFNGSKCEICSFTLENDDAIYRVPYLDFAYGEMISGNMLKAIEKIYRKRGRGGGFKRICEKINGVCLE